MVAITAISATQRGGEEGKKRTGYKRGHGQCISPLGNQAKALPSSPRLKIVTTYSLELEEKRSAPFLFSISLDVTST